MSLGQIQRLQSVKHFMILQESIEYQERSKKRTSKCIFKVNGTVDITIKNCFIQIIFKHFCTVVVLKKSFFLFN